MGREMPEGSLSVCGLETALLLSLGADDAGLVTHMLAAATGGQTRLDKAASAEAAKAYLQSNDYDLVLVDIAVQSHAACFESVRMLREFATAPIVVILDEFDQATELEFIGCGAEDVLERGGLSPQGLIRTATLAMERSRRASDAGPTGEAADRAIVVVSDAGDVLEANAHACNLLGRASRDLEGRSIYVCLEEHMQTDGEDLSVLRLQDRMWNGQSAHVLQLS